MIELNSKTLDKLRATIKFKEIAKNEAYYRGKNPPILSAQKKKKPDIRVPVALGSTIIKSLAGYAGRKGDIFINQVPKEGEDTDKSEFELKRREIDENNNGLLLNSLLYTNTLKQGVSYEVVWTEQNENRELEIKYAQIPNTQAVPVYEQELRSVKKLKYFVRFWQDTDIINGKIVCVEFAQVFEKGGYTIYKKVKSNNTSIKDDWVPKEDKDGNTFVVQPFENVQISVYSGNDADSSFIEPAQVLLDQMDVLTSKQMNEVERFNNTILAIYSHLTPAAKKNIEQLGVLDMGQNGGDAPSKMAEWLKRDVPTGHAQLMFETLTKQIYAVSGIPDFTNEAFGTSSGIAMAFKMQSLEYAAVSTDQFFDLGLLKRNELINEALRIKEVDTSIGEEYVPVVVHLRNKPADVETLSKNAIQLKGLGVSLETILKTFPKSIIPDVIKELELIEEEQNVGRTLLDDTEQDIEDTE